LTRWVDLQDDRASKAKETTARLQAAEAALERIEGLEDEEWVYADTVERMRSLYDYCRRRFAIRRGGDEGTVRDVDGSGEEDYEARSEAFKRFRRELIEAEREAVLRLRSESKIGDEVMRQIERDLDLEESRLKA
jgi:CPA1 family monovalent cation:H+ antiporter